MYCVLIEIATCFFGLLLAGRLFGRAGIVCYVCLGVFVANIQVLKVAALDSAIQLPGGTVVFCSLLWAQDWTTEVCGAKTALQNLWLTFFGLLLVTLWMQITIALPAVDFPENREVQKSLIQLFHPSIALFSASLLAYLASQCLDVLIFDRLKKATGGRWLWLRSGLSSLIATFIDHLLFSWLAFQLFAAVALPADMWLKVYVLHGYGLRVILALLSPFIVFLGVKLWHPQSNASPTLGVK